MQGHSKYSSQEARLVLLCLHPQVAAHTPPAEGGMCPRVAAVVNYMLRVEREFFVMMEGAWGSTDAAAHRKVWTDKVPGLPQPPADLSWSSDPLSANGVTMTTLVALCVLVAFSYAKSAMSIGA